jgi:DNA-binding transcriptional LysR family regulator
VRFRAFTRSGRRLRPKFDPMVTKQNLLKGFDLNLLLVFTVLFREKNVTRSAKLLGVGQPAVSNSLARLRVKFDDKLFLRDNDGMKPTKLATELYAELFPAVEIIESVLAQTGVVSFVGQTSNGRNEN